MTKQHKTRRPASIIFWRWAKVVVLLYCVTGLVIYYGQEFFFFHPVPVDRGSAYAFYGQPCTELNLTVDKATNLNVVQFRATDRPSDSLARGVILYFHGNSHHIAWYAPQAADLTRKGYEVWMMDYPGFGKSTGVFSEQKLYEEALLLYKLARSRWLPGQIILYGQHLGAGIAAQLADLRDCRRLILESPVSSMESWGWHHLPIYPWGRLLHYHFPIYSHLPAVTAPVTIFQGTRDLKLLDSVLAR